MSESSSDTTVSGGTAASSSTRAEPAAATGPATVPATDLNGKATSENAAATAGDRRVSVADLCRRMSRTVRSPELLAAFHHTERKAGRHADTEDAYRDRFAKFGERKVTT